MAIQHRHGEYRDFDPNKMVTAELAVVTSGDPASPTGRTLYICFAPGVVKRIVSYEDFENELQNATEEIQQAFTEEIRTAIANSIAATNAANEAKEAADLAAEAARKAAEAAGAYVLGDISGKTVEFLAAESRENINTGESTATMFGKIKKWFADLRDAAFCTVVNNLTTNVAGTVLDGRQGKILSDQLAQLNTNMLQIRSGWLTGLNISASENSSFRVEFDPFPQNCVIVIPIIRGGIFFPVWINLMENGWAEITAISTNGNTLTGRNIQWIAIGL